MSWKSVSDDKNFICHDFRLGFASRIAISSAEMIIFENLLGLS